MSDRSSRVGPNLDDGEVELEPVVNRTGLELIWESPVFHFMKLLSLSINSFEN